MNCKLCRERLQDYLDAMLEAAEQAQVSAHLDECAACRRELEELRKVVALVGSLEEVPEPMGFLQGVRERIDRPTVWERIRGLLTQPLRPGVSVAIPVIIVAFVGVFVLMSLLPKSRDHGQRANQQTPKPDGTPGDVAMLQERADGHKDAYESKSVGETGGAGGEHGLEYADGSEKGKDLTWTAGGPGGEKAEENGVRDDIDSVGRNTFSRSGMDLDEDQKLREQKETAGDASSTSGGSLLGSADSTMDQLAKGDARETTRDTTVTTDYDAAHEKSAEEQEQNGEPALALGARGPAGAERTKTLFQVQAGDEEMYLIVVDPGTDPMSARKIAEENGGHALVQRERDVLKGLLLYVPDKNFDKAVEALHLYNDRNRQALERKRAAAAEETKAGPQTLHLIIRRFIEGMDRQ
jgi:hypothetical protein